MKIQQKKTTAGLVLCAAIICGAFSALSQKQAENNPEEEEFRELSDNIRAGKGQVPETDFIKMLSLARELGRPFSAASAARSYAARNPDMPQKLQLMAARNSMLAGDFRNVVSRYKSYLDTAVPGRESSQIAGEMFVTQIDFLDAAGDAFASMNLYDNKFRDSDLVRKFDLWYLQRLQRAGDIESYTDSLINIFSEKMPREKERFFYWSSLEWLMNALRKPTSAHMGVTDKIESLVGLVRADNVTLAKYRFYLANLKYKSASVGKSAEAVVKNFDPVTVAARAFFDADPGLRTLQDILEVLSNNFNAAEWKIAGDKKQEFFIYAFGKLSDSDKTALLKMPAAQTQALLSGEQWESLCVANPKSFADAASFYVPAKTLDVFKKQAPFLQGKQSTYAAVVNSMAKADSFEAAAGYLIDNEAWHLPVDQVYGILESRLWPAFRAVQKEDLPADFYQKFLLDFGSEKLASSPLPMFDTVFADKFLMNAWKNGDKAKFVETLRKFEWIPYTEDQAKKVFDPVYKEFVAWTSQARTAATARKNAEEKIKAYKDAQARKTAAEAARKKAEAALAAGTAGAQAELNAANEAWNAADRDTAKTAGPAAEAEKVVEQLGKDTVDSTALIQEVESVIRPLIDAKSSDPEKAPSPLCKNLALAVQAVNAGQGEEFLKLAREIYPQIKDYKNKKIPFGSAVLNFVASNHFKDFDTFEFQLEIFKDQFTNFSPNTENNEVAIIFSAMSKGRPGWPDNTSSDDRDRILQVNSVIESALQALLDKNQFSAQLFTWLRQTRKGNRWQHGEAGNKILSDMIEKKTLLNTDYRAPGVESAACTYMWLVKNEFPRLQDKFPSASFFDDMFVQEASASGELDYAYWSLGTDSQGKVVNMASKQLQKYTTLPMTADEFNMNDNLWKWHSRCLQMDKKWRQERNVDEVERGKLIAMLETAFGTTRFDEFAVGNYYFTADADVSTPAGRKEFFNKLSVCIDRLSAVPDRLPPPAMSALADVSTLNAEELNVLMKIFPDVVPWTWRHGFSHELLIPLLQQNLLEQKRYGDLLSVTPYLWKMAKDINRSNIFREMKEFAAKLLDKGFYDIAGMYASCGVEIGATSVPDNIRVELQTIRTKAFHEIDATSVMVDRADPRFPIFQAQASFMSGNYQNARELYERHFNLVPRMFKELDPYFCIWLIQQDTEVGEFARANDLARDMMQWVDSLPEGFDREIKGQLLVAYADIAFARQEYPRARALFERIIATKEFAETTAQKIAELRVAEVDRLSRNFDRAMERLERLVNRPDKFLQTESLYQMALIKFELEDYHESFKLLDRVFSLEPNHTKGRLLRGKLDLQMKKFESATEVRLGLATDKRLLIPGNPLRVELDDKTGSVSARSQNIEVTATTDAGDKETFYLFLMSDSRTKFRGEIPTKLGKAQPENHVLELLGNDNVHYDYSATFKKAHNLSDMPVRLEVASDSLLKVSSGGILSEEEEQENQLQRLDNAMDEMDFSFLEETEISESIVRPGNPVYARVKDYDQSVSVSPDTVAVEAIASSGDSLKTELKETGPHTGVFSGILPTASAGAIAYASDYSEGNPPLHAIVEGDFEGWVGLLDNVRPKIFTVDINDYVNIDTMQIVSETPGRRLRNFILQTSVNGRDFQTLGSWPAQFKAWDGKPEFEFVLWERGGSRMSLEDIRRYIDSESMGRDIPRVKTPLSSMYASKESSDIRLDRNTIKLNWRRPSYVGRFRAAFYQPSAQTRTFKLEPKGDNRTMRYFFAIDGHLADESEGAVRDEDKLMIKRRMTRGVHFIDIYIFGQNNPSARFELLCDSDEPPYMIACPPAMFDPEAIPEIAEAVSDTAAVVTPNEEETVFDVKFAPETFARVIRFVISDFETDAPAINSISLFSSSEEKILPISQDMLMSPDNDVLEIVPGDTVSISYHDPKVVTEGKEVQEKIMKANFSNAEIWSPLFRFQPGERVDIFVSDQDCDVSGKPDVITIRVRTPVGEPVEIKAMEQDETRRGSGIWEPANHSGIFRGTVFPVEGQPKKANEIQVAPEESLVVVYQDVENTDPGVSWPRQLIIPQVSTEPPQLRVYEVTSTLMDSRRKEELAAQLEKRELSGRVSREEYVPPVRELIASRPVRPDYANPVSIISDGPLLVELTYPLLARSADDEAWIYVQTLSGREKAGNTNEAVFDVSVPGTIRVGANPGDFPKIEPPQGYVSIIVRGDPYASSPMFEGRFSFVVPKEFGPVPDQSFAMSEQELNSRNRAELPTPLYLKGNDTIFVGFPFDDSTGAKRWITQRVEMNSDVFFDIMDRYYREEVDSIHVGETLFLRVNHRSMDTTSEKDQLSVSVSVPNGMTTNVTLVETFEHTGSFKGVVKPMYVNDPTITAEENVIAVNYGDIIKLTYKAEGQDPVTREVVVRKGDDGAVVPFTKRFKDPEIAVQTQFLIAEAYFELAKKHRELEQESLARRQIAHGRRMLMEAIRDFPDSDAKVQADYLLADLALEYANDAENENIRRQNYIDAINGFSSVISGYPDSLYAPRAQYKKALAFEKMGDIDQACEEYVKLSYTYPDSDLIPQTIARLGHYFAEKGREMEAKLKETKDELAAEKLEAETKAMFLTAAQVFGRLAPRFPTHELAGKTLVVSGQCYMRAEEFDKAVKALGDAIAKTEGVDNELTSEAMYWRADAYSKSNDLLNAYREFRKLIWDYPASRWAKYARGRLIAPEMRRVAEQDKGI